MDATEDKSLKQQSLSRSGFTSTSLPLLGVLMAILVWSADSLIDVILFEESESFLESFFSPGPVELWMRCLVAALLVGFSFYARHLLNRQLSISRELEEYKNNLESLVAVRTRELEDEIEVRKRAEDELQSLAATDPLTGLFNRRKFGELLDYEIARHGRQRDPFSLILCDLDFFKRINDQHGHSVGDEVLTQVALLLKANVRKTDIVARWGGEEFILLLPNTNLADTAGIAEKLRSAIELNSASPVPVTASFGVAEFVEDNDEDALVSSADDALYGAKAKGRNCVEVSKLTD